MMSTNHGIYIDKSKILGFNPTMRNDDKAIFLNIYRDLSNKIIGHIDHTIWVQVYFQCSREIRDQTELEMKKKRI